MREWDEIAANMLPGYMEWLSVESDTQPMHRTMENARSFVKFDPILSEESAQMRDNIAAALHRLSGRIQ